ncbi:MAG: leucine-rich repeat domain-containing protein, partial [Methylococcales bacterium]|nr:leucine-rich repeat domain-containing protein [Methylococcales bacterium]
MPSLIPATVTAILIHITMATQALEPSICQLPECSCGRGTTHQDDLSNDDDIYYNVTCFVKSFTQSDRTIEKFTAEMTSVKLVCSDPHAQSYLTSGSFQRLPELVQLALENCNFVTTTVDAFSSAPKLESLVIKSCRFTELPKDVFSLTPRLFRLTLTHCALRTLPRICSLRSLQTLNVSGQELLSLEECVSDCGSGTVFLNLTILDVSNNSLLEAPRNLIDKAPSLRELYIRQNQLKELSLRGAVMGLEILDALGQGLEGAGFLAGGGEFSATRRLRVLKLQGNGTAEFPTEALRGLPNLT